MRESYSKHPHGLRGTVRLRKARDPSIEEILRDRKALDRETRELIRRNEFKNFLDVATYGRISGLWIKEMRVVYFMKHRVNPNYVVKMFHSIVPIIKKDEKLLRNPAAIWFNLDNYIEKDKFKTKYVHIKLKDVSTCTELFGLLLFSQSIPSD